MKNLIFTIICLAVIFNVQAQKNNKIAITIIDETSGEKRKIEKCFNSREEMYADKELLEFGLFSFDIMAITDPLEIDLAFSSEKIEGITAMASRIEEEVKLELANIDAGKIRTQVEMIKEGLGELEFGKGIYFRGKKPD